MAAETAKSSAPVGLSRPFDSQYFTIHIFRQQQHNPLIIHAVQNGFKLLAIGTMGNDVVVHPFVALAMDIVATGMSGIQMRRVGVHRMQGVPSFC